MSDCGRHSEAEKAGLDDWLALLEDELDGLTRRFMCADCGRRVEGLAGVPVCCEWEMVELPPAEFVR